MCLCNFGTLFGQCIGVFISCDLAMPWYSLQYSLFMFALSCRIRTWQSLASVDITVSVDLADSAYNVTLRRMRATIVVA